ncbi:MAG TPA: DUF488 domain-containing protein [Vulgatibacter sp.]|nr:DUF488 domain-containing protein [Vulgatibacter sp.]
MDEGWRALRLYTIGHSTRSLPELVEALHSFGIEILADIRTIPRSRRNPQFNEDSIATPLEEAGIRYVHLAGLGGLRRARADSPNDAWHNASFRGFADYMQTDDFEEGLAELRELAREGKVAIMCAESVPWRCHRSLVADAVTARGGQVEHLMSAGHSNPHRLTPFAKVDGSRVTYPAQQEGEPA